MKVRAARPFGNSVVVFEFNVRSLMFGAAFDETFDSVLTICFGPLRLEWWYGE